MRRKKRENKKRLYMVLILLLLLVLLTATGTISWLTKVSSITNTFTVGSFEKPKTSPTDPSQTITIDGNIYEPSWDANAEHRLIPAATFVKDPYVGIGAGSEDAVVYVYVENSFTNKVYFSINAGWEAVSGSTTAGYKAGTYTSGLFKYTAGLTAEDNADVWTATPLFSEISTDDSSEISDFTETADGKTEIKVSSFLHQAEDSNGTAISTDTIEAAVKSTFGI